jgi:hypothetical protein
VKGKARTLLLALVLAAFILPTAASAESMPLSCDGAQQQKLPLRPPIAPSGSEFARRVAVMSEAERDRAIESELLAGNIPSFLRQLAPVSLAGQGPGGMTVRVTICVLPDYLAIGSDADFLFVPMRFATALRIASRYGYTLPTSKMVDAIYDQSTVHLLPQPLPASDQMRSTGYYVHHNQLISEQRMALGARLGLLTSGHKKDIVIDARLWQSPARVAIYGWHRGSHDPIQPLSTVHGARYADYSHGVRLVGTIVYVDGERRSIFSVLADPQLAKILNRGGPIPRETELLAKLSMPPEETVAALPSGSRRSAALAAPGGATTADR